MQLRIADAQKDLLRKTAEGYARSLKITQNQYAAGTAASSDVATAETTLTNAQAALVDLETQRAADEHAIAVLTGQAPSDLTIAPDPNWTPKVPETPKALPATLLQRRPDVAIAERGAAAANAEIGVAVSGYFPTLDLSASGGYANTAIQELIRSSSTLWSLGSNVSETVFNAGATHFKIKQAKAAYDEAVANYRQAVLTAFQQVEDNLAADHVLQDEEPLRVQASKSADKAEQVTLNQYRAGTVAYTSVVTAQATALRGARADPAHPARPAYDHGDQPGGGARRRLVRQDGRLDGVIQTRNAPPVSSTGGAFSIFAEACVSGGRRGGLLAAAAHGDAQAAEAGQHHRPGRGLGHAGGHHDIVQQVALLIGHAGRSVKDSRPPLTPLKNKVCCV